MDDPRAALISSIQESPGGLVWVRRQNGSWWPGRIVQPEELPSKIKSSRRSGTAIKLLGKEDGSMDWYNLEKSMRVKPFRCGEYDECIEKVKAASATRSRKTAANMGKYVRREDAILHALDLERACLGISNSFLASSRPESRKILGLEPRQNRREPLQKKKRRTPNDSEDDEGTKRMRDLQEIGTNGTLKRKGRMVVPSNSSDDPTLPDCSSPRGSRIANGFSNVNQATSSKDSCLSLKRQRTNVVKGRENMRKKDRRRLLIKVCEGTKVIVPSYCHWDGSFPRQSARVTKDKIKTSISSSRGTDLSAVTSNSSECSGTSSEETFLDACEGTCGADEIDFDSEVKESELSSVLEFIDNDCYDGLVDIPLAMDENIYEDSSAYQHCATEKQSGCSPCIVVSCNSEGVSGSSFGGCGVQINHVRQQKENDGFVQYPDKKINMDPLTSRTENSESLDNGAVECKVRERKGSEILLSVADIKHGINISDESFASDCHVRMVKCELISSVVHQTRASQFTIQPKVALKFQSALSHTRHQERLSGEVVPTTRLALQSCSRHQASQQQNERGAGSPLYDVEVSVQSSYQGPQVPLVSLMSRLNGTAIVGHPVSVEVLISGAFDALVTMHRRQSGIRKTTSSLIKEGKSTRLPLKKVAAVRKYCKTGKYTSKKSKRLSVKQKISYKKKGFSPRKIRRLSSISVDQKRKEERKPLVEKIVGPAVTCIPLRLVFSRITEALSYSPRPACGS